MFQLKTTFDNVGGVTRCVAIPLSDFGQVKTSRLLESRTLTLRSTDNCIDIECNRSEHFSYALSASDDGSAYNHSFAGSIFTLDGNRELLLDKLSRQQWLLFVRTSNGQQYLLGTEDVPLTFSYTDSSGRYGREKAKIDYSFAALESEPALIIDNSPL